MKTTSLSAVFLSGLLAGLGQAAEQSFNAVPGSASYPTQAEWQAFNQSIGGYLQKTVPWAAVCYPTSGYYNKEACDQVNAGYTTGLKREVVYGSTEQIQYEACGNHNCQLFSMVPGLSLNALGTCELGRLSAYYVDARDPATVSATVKFARQHNIRLSIKNTGHDYLGRSVAPNTLAIWTHNMNEMKYYPTWTATNCSIQKENIGEIGAGAFAGDVYEFFAEHGMDIPGGNAASVGLAGGYGQTGGHGVFGPSRGLMVDNAVEFEVVTADGQVRVINECNDPDLFWAMRGGGGGNYAVLTKYKFQTYPGLPVSMHVFRANISMISESLSNNSKIRALLSAHVKNQINWSANNISGRHYYASNFVEFYTILPYADDGSKLKELTTDFVNEISSIPNLNPTENAYYHYDNYSAYNAQAQPVAARVTPNGYAAAVSSRLIPRWLFTPENATTLVDAFVNALQDNAQINQVLSGTTSVEVLMTTPANIPDTEGKTSANPSWRTALWHPVFTGGWTVGSTLDQQQQTYQKVFDAVNHLRDLTPGGGSYVNEDSILVDNWQETFWGSNYDRLLSIKQKYDPDHMFDCYKCVGWRGADE